MICNIEVQKSKPLDLISVGKRKKFANETRLFTRKQNDQQNFGQKIHHSAYEFLGIIFKSYTLKPRDQRSQTKNWTNDNCIKSNNNAINIKFPLSHDK